MGKSNNLSHEIKKNDLRKFNLNHFFLDDEIQILKDIYEDFLQQINIKFFPLFKKKIKFISYDIYVESLYNYSKKNFSNIKCCNFIEIHPYKKTSFIFFSFDFLSSIIDLSFGRACNISNEIKYKNNKITFTELFINKKITKFIISALSKSFKKIFSENIYFKNVKVIFSFNQFSLKHDSSFLCSLFNFDINKTKVFFNILIPLSIIKKINSKNTNAIKNSDNNVCSNINKHFSLKDIYNVEVKIKLKMKNVSSVYKNICNLSVGDVIPIEKPKKIIGYLEDKPIFFGDYKRFNQQTLVCIEKFINFKKK